MVAAGALGAGFSSRVGSARRCACSPARAANAEFGGALGRHRSHTVEPLAAVGPRVVRRLQACLQVVPRRRRHGALRPGRVQLAARVLPGDGVPGGAARPVRRLRRAEGVSRTGRAGRRPEDDRHPPAGHVDGNLGRRIPGRRDSGDLGGERRDDRSDQGSQPRVRARRDATLLEDTPDRDRPRRC